MCRLFIAIFLTVASTQFSFTQIVTTVTYGNIDTDQLFGWPMVDEVVPVEVSIPTFIRHEDLRLEQFAIPVQETITTKHGQFFEFGNYSIWKSSIRAIDATSITFLIEHLSLPKGGKLYIYNKHRTHIYGPITNSNVKNGKFLTEVIPGSVVIFEVFLPERVDDKFSISISKYLYGVKNLRQTSSVRLHKSYGDALDCIPDIACPEAAGWDRQADGVCMLINENGDRTSGTLLTDDCHTGTPYILTAQHVIDDESPEEFVVRFNYINTYCNSNNEPANYISYNGIQVRSRFDDTDMALLELSEFIRDSHSPVFNGWDRTVASPNTATLLHHPSGDAMKYSHDAAPPSTPNVSVDLGFVLPSGAYFEHQFTAGANNDVGLLQPGSSGAGVFDENGRLVAQLSGGSDLPDCDDPLTVWTGRFSVSWDGGGTTDTRLRDWLGSNINPVSTNSVKNTFISGSDAVCSSSTTTFTLQEVLPGWNVTWNVEPSQLFAGSTSGSGTTATLQSASYHTSGEATLTFVMHRNECGSRTITQNIWVGRPQRPNISLPSCFSPSQNYSLFASSNGATSYTWSFPSCPYLPSDPDRCWHKYSSGSSGSIFINAGEQSGSVSVFTSNNCGTSSRNRHIEFCDDGGGGGGGIIYKRGSSPTVSNFENASTRTFSISPNPTKVHQSVNIRLHSTTIEGTSSSHVKIVNQFGQVVHKIPTNNSSIIKLPRLHPGLYYVQLCWTDGVSISQLLLQK